MDQVENANCVATVHGKLWSEEFNAVQPHNTQQQSSVSTTHSAILHQTVLTGINRTEAQTGRPIREVTVVDGQGLIFKGHVSYDTKIPLTNQVLKPHSTPSTLMWLEDNYEIGEGVCIPRNTLYLHYVDFCSKNNMQPVNAASFGKIIRQQFPQLTTRRLGTRGQSRYHYYGIAVKECSIYFQPSYSKKSVGCCQDSKREQDSTIKRVPQTCQTRIRPLCTVLPEFPSVQDLVLPPNVDSGKLHTFLMMYKTHSQRILDTVYRGCFEELQNFLFHFWQGVPPHLLTMIGSNVLVNVIGICDSILYRGISNVLLPSILQPFPDSLMKIIRKFVQELDCWLRMALYNLPENLKIVKLEMARRFAQLLRRQMSLNHLSQASRMVLHNSEIMTQMLRDWRMIDVEALTRETLYTTENNGQCGTSGELIVRSSSFFSIYLISKEFESLIEDEAPIEIFMEWLENLVSNCITAPCNKKKPYSVRRQARQFLLLWSAFGSRVIRDMTLHSAASFGSFHLLRLMFDDYILFLVENIYLEEQVKDYLENISKNMAPKLNEMGCDDIASQFGDAFSNSVLEVETSENTYCEVETPEVQTQPAPSPLQEVPTSVINTNNVREDLSRLPINEQVQTHFSTSPLSTYSWNGEYYQNVYSSTTPDTQIRPWNDSNQTCIVSNVSGACSSSTSPTTIVTSTVTTYCTANEHTVQNYIEQPNDSQTFMNTPTVSETVLTQARPVSNSRNDESSRNFEYGESFCDIRSYDEPGSYNRPDGGYGVLYSNYAKVTVPYTSNIQRKLPTNTITNGSNSAFRVTNDEPTSSEESFHEDNYVENGP